MIVGSTKFIATELCSSLYPDMKSDVLLSDGEGFSEDMDQEALRDQESFSGI